MKTITQDTTIDWDKGLVEELLTQQTAAPPTIVATPSGKLGSGESSSVPGWLIGLLIAGVGMLLLLMGNSSHTSVTVPPPANYGAGTEFTPPLPGLHQTPLLPKQGPVIKTKPSVGRKPKAVVGDTSGPIASQLVSASAQASHNVQGQAGFRARHDALNAQVPDVSSVSKPSTTTPPRITKTTNFGGGGSGGGGGGGGGGTTPPSSSKPTPPPASNPTPAPPVAKVPAPAGPANDGAVAKNGNGAATQNPNVSDQQSGNPGSLGTGGSSTNSAGNGSINSNTGSTVTGVTTL